VGIAAVLLVMVALYLLTSRQVAAQRIEVARLSDKVKRTEPQLANAKAILKQRDRLAEQMQSLEIVQTRRYAALELLRGISFYAPKDIVLTHFTMKPEQPLELRGSAGNLVEVAALQHAMGLSPLVKTSSLAGMDRVSSQGRVAERISFTMQLHLWTERETQPRAISLRRQGGSQ